MGYKRNYNSLLPDDFVLSEEFETIIEQLENTKDHFYITGKAGSGKSTLLAYFRSITKKILLFSLLQVSLQSVSRDKLFIHFLASLPRLFRQGTLRK